MTLAVKGHHIEDQRQPDQQADPADFQRLAVFGYVEHRVHLACLQHATVQIVALPPLVARQTVSVSETAGPPLPFAIALR